MSDCDHCETSHKDLCDLPAGVACLLCASCLSRWIRCPPDTKAGEDSAEILNRVSPLYRPRTEE